MQILEGFVFMKKKWGCITFFDHSCGDACCVGACSCGCNGVYAEGAYDCRDYQWWRDRGICCVGTSWRFLHRAGERQTEISVGASDRTLLFSGAVSDWENDISFGGRLWLSDSQQRHDLCGGRDDRRNACAGKPHRCIKIIIELIVI